jgi:hypothetical protein
MDMVFRYMSLENFHLVFLANAPYQLSNSFSYQTDHHFLSIFGYPHDIVLAVIGRVARFSVVLHTLRSWYAKILN